jgi:hypothetical protein
MKHILFLPVLLASVLFFAEDSPSPAFDPAHTVRVQLGDLDVVFGDHYEHAGSGRENYTGIHHLSHTKRASNVFCPLYAGMIGVRQKCHIEPVDDKGAVISIGEGASAIREMHRVVAPHYIDYTAEITAGAEVGFWNNTSYMNGPADPGIYVKTSSGPWVRHYSKKHGHAACVAPEGMDPLPPVTKADNPDYPHGSNHFHEGFRDDLRYDPHWPVYYGRFDDMVLIFMMERDKGPYFIPYMSPTGGGYSKEFERSNPAWDHRFHLKGLTPGEKVVVRQRICYKPYVSDADVESEYERWLATLKEEKP